MMLMDNTDFILINCVSPLPSQTCKKLRAKWDPRTLCFIFSSHIQLWKQRVEERAQVLAEATRGEEEALGLGVS